MSEQKPLETNGDVIVSKLHAIGMVTIRADLENPDTLREIEQATGLSLPKTRHITGNLPRALAWMSPDELLLFCEDPEAKTAALSSAISGHALVVDVSHARAVFSLQGNGAREVLAKGAPVDLSPLAFQTGDFRRSRLGQVPVAFWLQAQNPDRFCLVCFSSVQDFMFEWLGTASAKGSLPGFLV